MTDLVLTKLSETATTITLGWTPPAGAKGYVFYADTKRSSTLDGSRSSVRFAKGSSVYRVQALGLLAEGAYPPPVVVPPPTASKLPPLFATGWTPATVQTFPAGTYTGMTLTGTDKRFVFAPGAVLTGTLVLGALTRCEIVGLDSRGSHDGVKFVGGATDVWLHDFTITGARNQGILGVGVNRRVWVTDGTISNNNPDLANPDWRTQCHGIYLGSQGSWDDGVLGNVQVTGQKTGYGFQAYESAQRLIVTSCYFNTPGTPGFRADVGIATIWSGSSAGNLIVNTVAENCRGPLAVGGAGARVPAVTVSASAALNCGGYADGQPGAVAGQWATSLSVTADEAYRLPWDTRTAGIGTF